VKLFPLVFRLKKHVVNMDHTAPAIKTRNLATISFSSTVSEVARKWSTTVGIPPFFLDGLLFLGNKMARTSECSRFMRHDGGKKRRISGLRNPVINNMKMAMSRTTFVNSTTRYCNRASSQRSGPTNVSSVVLKIISETISLTLKGVNLETEHCERVSESTSSTLWDSTGASAATQD
jgi:hypothetical protein